MPSREKSSLPKILLILVVLGLLGWAAWGAFRSGEPPRVVIESSRDAVGRPGTTFTLRFEAADSLGLGFTRVEVVQEGRVLFEREESLDEPSLFEMMTGPEGTSERQAELTLGYGQPEGLEEGEVSVRAIARPTSGPLAGGDAVVEELTLPVVFRPPTLGLASTQHYVAQGGSGAVAFRVGDRALRSGVRVGEEEFPSFPRGGKDERERVALFGVPFDHSERAELRLFAEDAAGNRAEAPFLDGFKARPPRRDVIRLSNSFLERVVPPIESRTPQLSQEGSLVERYVAINDGLRKLNRASIDELASRSTPPLLVTGGLYTMRNAARMAGFAETRRYLYEGEQVDQQTHLGLDLASIARAEVPAAAPGRVVFADYMGIYGNAVVVDHGMGLLTLYAHLSSIGVGEGEQVAEGAIIGRSGQSGLAGGDHLHFGVFVHGVAVEPIEWIDGSWVKNRILRVIEARAPDAAAS